MGASMHMTVTLKEASCIVCYTPTPVTSITATDAGTMCSLCQGRRPDRVALTRYWAHREEVLEAELARVRLARQLAPTV